MTDEPTVPAVAGPLDVPVGRFLALRLIASKRRLARELHECARYLGAIPGRERDANNVSKEAAIIDADVAQMLGALTPNVGGEPHATS